MKNAILIIFLVTILVSCGTVSPELMHKSEVRELYFPTYDERNIVYHTDNYGNRIMGVAPIRPNDSLSQFVNDWYSKHLYSLKEPILYNKTNKSIDVIRFTHLGTWSNPYSCRIELAKSNVTITYNKTNGQGGYKPGRRIEHKTKILDVEKWDLVISKMDSIDFWNMETHDKNTILDGAEWIFEALINGRYHFITRNSPDQYDGKEYAELCNLIVKMYNE